MPVPLHVCFRVCMFGVYHGASVQWCINLFFSEATESKSLRSVAAVSLTQQSNSAEVTLIVRIWSGSRLGGPVLWCSNTRGCGTLGHTTHQLAILKQQGNKGELPAEEDCWVLDDCSSYKLRKRGRVEATC